MIPDSNVTENQKHLFLLGYFVYIVVLFAVITIVLRRLAAQRHREEAIKTELLRQQEYDQWNERYGRARRIGERAE
jgi:hypothetical protein